VTFPIDFTEEHPMTKKSTVGSPFIFILVLLIIFATHAPAVFAVPEISLPANGDAVPGQQVDIPINMTQSLDAVGFSGFNFRLSYDTAILSNPTPVVQDTYCEGVAPGSILEVLHPADGGDYAIAVMTDLSAPTDGTIIKIRFDVDTGFTSGSSDILFVEADTSKSNINALFVRLDADFVNGTIRADTCPDDPDKTAPGSCGCGTPDTDSDNDGTADCNETCPDDPDKTDPGVCGCGIADSDTDNDGTLDCNDTCPDDPLKTAPGFCGCGSADTDCDADGTADCADEDDDDDGMSDVFEIQYNLSPCDPDDAGEDADNDGFTNLEEYHSGTSPRDNSLYPQRPEVVALLPHANQGIDEGTLRVPYDSSINLRIQDDTGLDESRFLIQLTTIGQPASTIAGTLLYRQLMENDPSDYWLTFIPENSFVFDAEIEVSVRAADQDGLSMAPYDYRFGVETEAAHDAAQDDAPASTRDESDPGVHQLWADPGTGIAGAGVFYAADETVIPHFGPMDEVPELGLAEGCGQPVSITPPAVYRETITLFIPCPDVDDVSELVLYFYDPATGWVPACDTEGNVQSGADGWMVPGSRVNHNDSDIKTIEIQVLHSGIVQAGTEETPPGSGNDGCFLSTLLE
jgi:Cohesin domain